MIQMNLLKKQKETHFAEWGGIIREFGRVISTLLYLKWITNRDLLYSTWNSVQCLVQAWIGGESGGRMDTHICIVEPLHCSLEAITLLIGYTLIQNIYGVKKIKF